MAGEAEASSASATRQAIISGRLIDTVIFDGPRSFLPHLQRVEPDVNFASWNLIYNFVYCQEELALRSRAGIQYGRRKAVELDQ